MFALPTDCSRGAAVRSSRGRLPCLRVVCVSDDTEFSGALSRRDFLALGAASAAAVASGRALGAAPTNVSASPSLAARRGDAASHVVVLGAGVWGSFTALELRRRGHRVTVVDAYGPGNSRSTSGDETRGIRSSYGDRGPAGLLWTRWAHEAIARWTQFDAEHARTFGTRFFERTGDIILRTQDELFLQKTREHWTTLGVPFEQIDGAEVMKRWPVINADDTTVALYEPGAGVARARASTQAAAALAQRAGATFITARATLGAVTNGRLEGLVLADGRTVKGDQYVLCVGPWFRMLLPELMLPRTRVPIGHVCYFATPPGDERFTAPNIPSWNIPGVTGWPSLAVDARGFRVRGALPPPPPPPGEPPPAPPPPLPPDPAQQDPDRSSRVTSQDRIDGARRVLARRFPVLADAPLNETRACHYEISVSSDFLIDRLPGADNCWMAGLGQAEGFKFAPVVSRYIADRVEGRAGDDALAKAFALPAFTYDTMPRPAREDDE
jgi:glycine/D-amino acid oxidase-like deaminating enzyme